MVRNGAVRVSAMMYPNPICWSDENVVWVQPVRSGEKIGEGCGVLNPDIEVDIGEVAAARVSYEASHGKKVSMKVSMKV